MTIKPRRYGYTAMQKSQLLFEKVKARFVLNKLIHEAIDQMYPMNYKAIKGHGIVG